MSVVKPQPHRGEGLLLVHCSDIAPNGRPTAYTRLEDLIGGDLARLLVRALAGPQGRRASSSP